MTFFAPLGSLLTSIPSILILPLKFSIPIIDFIRVVFPAPFGPRIRMWAPGFISRDSL